MSICQQLFQTYGTPDKLIINGDPLFTLSIFQKFLQTWSGKHWLSSVTYPQINSWVEIMVKTAKRIVSGNPGPLRFIGQRQCLPGYPANIETPQSKYWPITSTTSYSTANSATSMPLLPILYNQHLKWVVVAQWREEILHHHNVKMVEKYNRYIHNFCPLRAGDTVAIQSRLNCQCNTTGKIIIVLPDRTREPSRKFKLHPLLNSRGLPVLIPLGHNCGLNKGCSSKFCEGSRVRQTPEEGRRTYRPKTLWK